jgi:hypothetical protein
MSTRRVRGETGALFEVDASMLAPTDREQGYRESSAPPRATEIQPAPRAARNVDALVGLASGLAVACGAVVLFVLAYR